MPRAKEVMSRPNYHVNFTWRFQRWEGQMKGIPGTLHFTDANGRGELEHCEKLSEFAEVWTDVPGLLLES